MILDVRQTQETANGTNLVYIGGVFVDEDIQYIVDGKEVFLPANKAGFGGIIWNTRTTDQGGVEFAKPVGIYFYNNKQYRIPIRYAYINGELLDYGEGYEALIRTVPTFDGQNINPSGAIIYLSPKVAFGLFAQLYLLDDAFGNYDKITLAHSEDDALVLAMKEQGVNVGDIVYFGGLRGPLKIFEVNYPDNIIEREEFLRLDGKYAEFDNLTFTK